MISFRIARLERRGRYKEEINEFKGVMKRSMVDPLSELCSLFIKGGNSSLNAATVRGVFRPNEYWSLE